MAGMKPPRWTLTRITRRIGPSLSATWRGTTETPLGWWRLPRLARLLLDSAFGRLGSDWLLFPLGTASSLWAVDPGWE